MIEYRPPSEPIVRVYEDDDLVVVNKPSGLLSVPGRVYKDCLMSRLQEDYPTIRCVHRLDMETSGLMVLALHKTAQIHLNRQFEQRLVKKHYVARVIGHPTTNKGEINLPLICDWPNRPKQKVDYVEGKPALTHWQLKCRESHTSLIDLTPVTGRSHQLRVHLWHVGLPIVADSLYSHPSISLTHRNAIKALQRKTGRPSLHLHSTQLSFEHPGNKRIVSFKMPTDFM